MSSLAQEEVLTRLPGHRHNELERTPDGRMRSADMPQQTEGTMESARHGRLLRGGLSGVGRVLLTAALLCLAVGAAWPRTALAWKPITHVYLSEVARQDAIDDGYVTLYRVDYATGAIGAALGEYPVDPDTLRALRSCPAQYRAGCSFADFMPDLAASQLLVHPDNRSWGNTRSDDWLQRIWYRAGLGTLPADLNPLACTQDLAVKAYAVGLLTHAAGDMYGHTYVNVFAGGSWDLVSSIAPRHLLLEEYIGMRTPDDGPGFYDISIDQVGAMIYDEMLGPNNPGGAAEILTTDWRLEDLNLSRLFGGVRQLLVAVIDNYDTTVNDYTTRYNQYLAAADACAPWDFGCSAVALRGQAALELAAKERYIVTYGPFVAYLRAWRDDIDEGLRAWPAVSFEAHRSGFFHQPATYYPSPDDILEPWVADYLFPMMGVPDLLADFVFLDPIKALLPDRVEQMFETIKAGLYNWIVRSALGQQFAEWAAYLTSPQLYFDDVPTLFPNSGCWLTLHDFNHSELMIHDTGYALMDEKFDWQQFRPAYNTVTMIKLSFLSRAGLDDLLGDLASGLNTDGVVLPMMLGFVNSFDQSNQGIDPVRPSDGTMLLARDPAAYRTLFMQQRGVQLADEASGVPCDERYDEDTDGQDSDGEQAVLTSFHSNGDCISGWYWLRDAALSHYAEWEFRDIPAGSGDLTLDITALATDRVSGGRRFDAVFRMSCGVPGGDALWTQIVTLPNISLDSDPVGYTCRGTVPDVPRAVLAGGSRLLVRVERVAAGDHHVAFNAESMKPQTGTQ